MLDFNTLYRNSTFDETGIEMCLQMELKKILQRGDFMYLGT